jgi:hypothetical protein
LSLTTAAEEPHVAGLMGSAQWLQPGTYKADASPGCYWARLKSLDTSDIIDNQNTDGPVVLQILSTDKAVEVARCGEFHKVG